MTATRSASSATVFGPREASTTRERYWVRVTSSPASAERARRHGDEDATGAEDGIDHRVGFNVLGPAVYMHLLTIA